MNLRTAGAAVAALLALAATGCQGDEDPVRIGGGTASPSPTPAPTTPSSSSGSPGSTGSTDSPPPVAVELGSLTAASTGERFSTTVQVGAPFPDSEGSPPDDVLSACGWDDPSVKQSAVWVPLVVHVDYQGRVKAPVAFSSATGGDITDLALAPQASVVPVAIATPDGNGWQECLAATPWQHDMEPGSELDLAAWALLPTASGNTSNLVWTGVAVDQNAGLFTHVDTDGTFAVTCDLAGNATVDFDAGLALYNQPPFDFTGADNDGGTLPGRCDKP